jgi:hypothetical protein
LRDREQLIRLPPQVLERGIEAGHLLGVLDICERTVQLLSLSRSQVREEL